MNVSIKGLFLLLLVLGGCASSPERNAIQSDASSTAHSHGVQMYGSLGASVEYGR